MELVAITARVEETLPQILGELYRQMKKQGFPLGNSRITIREPPQDRPLSKIKLENPGHFNLEMYVSIASLIQSIRENEADAFYILDVDVIKALTETLPLSLRLANILKNRDHVCLASGLCRIYWEHWQQAYQEAYGETAPPLLCREELHPELLKKETISAALEPILYQKVLSATSCTTVQTEQERMLYTIQITDLMYVDAMWVQQENQKPLCYAMQDTDGLPLYNKDGKGFSPDTIQMDNQELDELVTKIVTQYQEKHQNS